MAHRVMTNELVLGKIADELPVRTLLDLRSTCTLWNTNFIPPLKKKHPKIEVGYDTYDGDSDSESNERVKNIETLVQVLQFSPDVPFGGFSFFFGSPVMGQRSAASTSLDCINCGQNSLLEFMKTFGRSVSRLEIKWQTETGTEIDVNELQTIIFDLCPELRDLELDIYSELSEDTPISAIGQELKLASPWWKKLLPNLKRFAVNAIFQPNPGLNRAFQKLIMAVIRSAVELEELRLEGDGGSEPENKFVGGALSWMAHNPSRLPKFSKLKTLGLHMLLVNSELRDLVQLGAHRPLRLDSFTVDALCIETNPALGRDDENGQDGVRLVHDFLVTQLEVKELVVYISADDSERARCYLPRMERIQKLKLIDSTFQIDQIEFTMRMQEGQGEGRGTFLDTFPGLTHFSCAFDQLPPADVETSAIGRLFHPGVTHFNLETTVGDYMKFASFGPVFPSLTRLELTLVEECGQSAEVQIWAKEFSKIWSTWPALTSLKLEIPVEGLDFDLDVFITGVPRAGLERLRRQHDQNQAVGPHVPLTVGSLRAFVRKFKTRPGISDLKHLREFTMTFQKEPDKENPQLTDMGGYFGLALASPALQHLVIQSDGKNLVSEECQAFIRKTFGYPVSVISL